MKDKIFVLQEDDFRTVIEDNGYKLTESEFKGLIKHAKENFTIYDWSEHVDAFISHYMDIKEKVEKLGE